MYMRIHNLLYLAFSLLLLASCASDNDVASDDNGGKNDYEGVTATVLPVEFDATSRSSLSFGSSGMTFAWSSGDELTILSDVDNSSRSIYTLKQNLGPLTASFDGGGFKLVRSARYYAFSKAEGKNSSVNIPDKANITVDYSGQRQVASGTANTSHLGDYDFMAATATCSPDIEDNAHFKFQHLGFTLYIKMTGVPSTGKYKKLEIYDSKNMYRKPVRTIDLSKGLDVATGTYAPAFNPENVQSEEYKTAPRFSLLLGPDTDEGISADANGQLDLFIELPPVDMSDNTFVFSLVPANSETKPFFMKSDDSKYKKPYVAGKAYMIAGEAKQTTTYEVSLKVNHDWQLGNAVSRATGDPGNEEKYEKPKYIYYVFCVGGNVKQVDEHYYNRITVANPETDWTTSSDKVLDTYNKNTFTFSVEETEKGKTKNVYFVASTSDLSSSFSGITSSTTEAEIQNLVYSIQNASTSNTALDNSQTFLRDLYSTPWESQSTFIGALKDPYQDVILYHVAAKVDLKWNSSAILSGNVSVNNVMSTNLSLFKPTANPTTGTANYTVTNAIDEETMFNGRQVFYLPQFKTYNVTVGGNVQDGSADHPLVTFTPATTNGWTSWLRWLKKY